MATHVVLLRGVNVGGRHRLPMAAVRERLTDQGFAPVGTYIQSGNVVLTSRLEDDEVAARVAGALTALAGFPVPAVALGVQAFDEVVAANPFTPAAPKLEHVILLPRPAEPDLAARITSLADADTSTTEVQVRDRAVYVHHPEGLMQSALAQQVTALLSEGTARNLASMTAIGALARRV